MKLVLANRTHETLVLCLGSSESGTARRGTDAPSSITVLPYASATFTAPQLCKSLRIEQSGLEKQVVQGATVPNGLTAVIPLRLGAKWKSVHVPSSDAPWRIYRSKVVKGIYKISVFERRDLASFLSQMPDSLPLSSLLLPGTHDTMAFHGWPISQCQSSTTPLETQLQSGIRVLDIRLAVVDGHLIAYHGIYPQRTPFQDILSTVHDFLTAPATCHEGIVMSIKQEDFTTTPLPLFSQTVHDEIMNGPGGRDMWFLENRIPLLGEVRGKVVMLSRFGGDGSGWENGLEGLGIHPTAWPDSAKDGFTWTLKGTLVRTHDWYDIPSFLSIPEKATLASENLLPPADTSDPPTPVLNISFFSAASFPFAFPPTVAQGFGWPKIGLGIEGVNGRLGMWLLDQLGGDSGSGSGQEAKGNGEKGAIESDDVRIRGWAFTDYFSQPADVVPLLVECNFRGRKSGEEGWE